MAVGIVVGAGGIMLILLIWGASVLYRGLDGDRFLLSGRVRGRWTNPVNFRLCALGLAAITLGWAPLAWITFNAAPGIGPAWMMWSLVLSLTIALTPAAFAWAWVGRRAAGRPRCPRCLYNVAGLVGMTCPECGFVAESDAFWHKPRKRMRGFVFAALVPFAALVLLAFPFADVVPWRTIVPTRVLIARLDTLDDGSLGLSPMFLGNFTILSEYPAGSLIDRRFNNRLSQAELDAIRQRLEDILSTSRDPDQFLRLIAAATQLTDGITVAPPAGELAAWIDAAIVPSAQRAVWGYPYGWLARIEFILPADVPTAERQALITRLIDARVEPFSSHLSHMMRGAVIAALARDDDDAQTMLIASLFDLHAAWLARANDQDRNPRFLLPAFSMMAVDPSLLADPIWAGWFAAETPADRAVWTSMLTDVLAARAWAPYDISGDPLTRLERAAMPLSPTQVEDVASTVLADLDAHPETRRGPFVDVPPEVAVGRQFLIVLLQDGAAEALLVRWADDDAHAIDAGRLAILIDGTGASAFPPDTLAALLDHRNPAVRTGAATGLLWALERPNAHLPAYADQILALPPYPEFHALKDLVRPWATPASHADEP
jgi:hypothetical protein